MSEAPAPTKPAPTFNIGDRVTVGTENPIVGTITDTRLHSSGKWTQYCVVRPNPNGGNMTHWVKDVALTHARSISEMLDAGVTGTDIACDYCEVAPRMEGSNYCADCSPDMIDFITPQPPIGDEEAPEIPSAAPLDINSLPPRRMTPDEYVAAFANKIADDMQADVDAITAAVNRANEAEQHADAEAKRADKLERQLIQLQDAIAAGQPITMTNVAPVKECVRYKTVAQQLLGYPEDLNRADAELASLENEGWEQVNVSYVGNQDGADARYVMFKRIDAAQPAPQPERTTSASATPAAMLTGVEVRAERMKQGFEQQVIEHPVTLNSAPATASEVLDKWRGVFSEFTPEEVSANLDRIAGEKALANHNARVANQPDFSTRPLLLSVVVPS